ncbi:MAG: hypothetical protein KUG77_06665 [Nannocystaceae bacterium]|nr:hypothetical protein [Nannocystaceae bacterium]
MDRLRNTLLAGSCLLFFALVCCAKGQATRVPFESLPCPDDGMACELVEDGGIGCCGRAANGSTAAWMCPSDLGGRVVAQPQPVAGLIGAVHIDVIDRSLCARISDGTVRCYGSTKDGGLGLASPEREVDRASPMPEPETQCNVTAVAVPVAGVDSATALFGRCVLQQGELLCWGDRLRGAPQRTRRDPAIPLATPLGGFEGDVSSVDGLCAVHGEDGHVRCWAEASRSPINGRHGVEQLAMGSMYGGSGCALIYGRAHCWNATSANKLLQVAGLGRALELGSSAGSACALLEDETVSCWGQNEHGQLGDGSTQDRDRPVAVQGLENVKQIQLGLFLACALLSDGSVSCWGALPTDDGYADHPAPVRIAGLPPARRLALGGNTLCAITDTTEVYCWGNIFTPEDAVVREQGVESALKTEPQEGPIAEDVTPIHRPSAPVTCSKEFVYCSGDHCYASEDDCLDIRARTRPLAPSCERRETTYVDERNTEGGRLCGCREGRCRRCPGETMFEQCTELPSELPCGLPDWDMGEPLSDADLLTRCDEIPTVDHASGARSRYCATGARLIPRSCPEPPPNARPGYCSPVWVEQKECFRDAEKCEVFRSEGAKHLPDSTERACRVIAP